MLHCRSGHNKLVCWASNCEVCVHACFGRNTTLDCRVMLFRFRYTALLAMTTNYGFVSMIVTVRTLLDCFPPHYRFGGQAASLAMTTTSFLRTHALVCPDSRLRGNDNSARAFHTVYKVSAELNVPSASGCAFLRPSASVPRCSASTCLTTFGPCATASRVLTDAHCCAPRLLLPPQGLRVSRKDISAEKSCLVLFLAADLLTKSCVA